VRKNKPAYKLDPACSLSPPRSARKGRQRAPRATPFHSIPYLRWPRDGRNRREVQIRRTVAYGRCAASPRQQTVRRRDALGARALPALYRDCIGPTTKSSPSGRPRDLSCPPCSMVVGGERRARSTAWPEDERTRRLLEAPCGHILDDVESSWWLATAAAV